MHGGNPNPNWRWLAVLELVRECLFLASLETSIHACMVATRTGVFLAVLELVGLRNLVLAILAQEAGNTTAQ